MSAAYLRIKRLKYLETTICEAKLRSAFAWILRPCRLSIIGEDNAFEI
jgi:hypothetical protein